MLSTINRHLQPRPRASGPGRKARMRTCSAPSCYPLRSEDLSLSRGHTCLPHLHSSSAPALELRPWASVVKGAPGGLLTVAADGAWHLSMRSSGAGLRCAP